MGCFVDQKSKINSYLILYLKI